jgi:hypothetical protein
LNLENERAGKTDHSLSLRRTIVAGFNDPVHFPDDYLFFFVIVDSIPLLAQQDNTCISSPDQKSLLTESAESHPISDQQPQQHSSDQTPIPCEPVEASDSSRKQEQQVSEEEPDAIASRGSPLLTVQTQGLDGGLSVPESFDAAPDPIPSGEKDPQQGESQTCQFPCHSFPIY